MDRKEDFRACYQSTEDMSPRPVGLVRTDFLIDDTGKASKASVKETTLKQPKVEACILSVIKTIRFPPTPEKGGVTQVTYPFKFSGY